MTICCPQLDKTALNKFSRARRNNCQARLFTKGQAWVDRGAEHFEQNRQTRDLARLQAQAGSRGFRLVPVPGEPA